MKKKILLFLALVSIAACFFAIAVSAETPSLYIEFGARFPGSDEYITVYTENAEDSGNPRINFATKKFYSDVDFTNEVDMSTATGIDFSVTKTYVNGVQGKAPTRMTKPSTPFTNCVEVKWFLEGFPTISYNGSFFQNWTGLKTIDFGNATAIADNTFEGCTGLEEITIPSTITSFGGSIFKDCTSLKSVKIEGAVTKVGNGSTFYGCTALETVDLGQVTVIGEKMFYGCTMLSSIDLPSTITEIKSSAFQGCTSLSSIDLPSTITEIKGSTFRECTSLTSVTIPEGVTSIGNCAFYKSGITSLHIPAKVQTLGYQVAEETPITSLTFAENSQLETIDHRAFMNCKQLEGTVILPDGVVDIEYGLFSGCTKLKAVKMPDTVSKSTEGGAMFSGCSSLEYVQLSKNLPAIPGSMFENCTSLKAISIPEGVTTLGSKALRKCTSLQAIYLPSTLTTLGVTESGSDKGVFYQSNNVYFVQEAFDVFNGDELIGDSFVMPSKPEVYYMPSGLSFLGNSEFQDCKQLNSYVVFPKGVTSAAGCSQGAFQGVGNASSPVTIVFLGDMTALNIKQNDATYSNISFVFANPNDVDLNSITLTIGAANNRTQTNTYMYFCAGKVSYDLSTFTAANGADYTVVETDFTKTEYTEETQPHFVDPSKTATTSPTCTENEKETTYCFCGASMDVSEVENTALGHAHNIFAGLIYTDYSQSGYYGYKCERCDDVNKDKTAPALFTCIGYSTPENSGGGLVIGYSINNSAIDEYEAIMGNSICYGVFAVSQNVLGDKDLFEVDDSAIIHELTSDGLDAFEIKIVGFETDAQKSAKLAIGAYVIDGESVSYLQEKEPSEGQSYYFASYYDIYPKQVTE